MGSEDISTELEFISAQSWALHPYTDPVPVQKDSGGVGWRIRQSCQAPDIQPAAIEGPRTVQYPEESIGIVLFPIY